MGGMYIDVDYKSLSPIDDLIENKTYCFVEKPESHCKVFKRTINQVFNNAMMLSIPEHPFIRRFYQIPDSILGQTQYFQFFGKRNDLPEIKFMHPYFRVIADKDSTLFFTALSYLENTDTLFMHAKFVYQDTIRNSTFYGVNNVIISPKFDLINSSSELRRALTNKNDLHVKHKDLPADQLYDIFHRMISQVPDSHSNTLLLYDEKETFFIEQLMSLRSLLSKQQKQIYITHLFHFVVWTLPQINSSFKGTP